MSKHSKKVEELTQSIKNQFKELQKVLAENKDEYPASSAVLGFWIPEEKTKMIGVNGGSIPLKGLLQEINDTVNEDFDNKAEECDDDGMPEEIKEMILEKTMERMKEILDKK